ncbi:31d2142f-7e12-4cf1-9a0a-884652173e0d [Thermothielavioides terrestris]|uniref:Uncharacterized protein n=2 Tax=Thermothielavioides terrestris TaxID=2587410 RepID=G2R7H9_THETT|nr:uncharacterized protein THITE_2117049 [Thermothielavioides terrestris NRRL 8126]AEO67888.1 hypothetical protein THITE_2117049 [Thermothielavioides terrestris NRRL 8126]SPQ24885.1 31d2142f-7e12-4cf1-9a0a-884652173e0d [Thermothielavioides terrestris]
MAPNGIPIATLGGNAKIAEGVSALLAPDYDFVHICLSPETALAELPQVCAGKLDGPNAAQLGSNAQRAVGERRTPKAVVFGAGVADAEADNIVAAIKEVAPDINIVRVPREEVVAASGGKTPPEVGVIAKIVKEKLDALVAKGLLEAAA